MSWDLHIIILWRKNTATIKIHLETTTLVILEISPWSKESTLMKSLLFRVSWLVCLMKAPTRSINVSYTLYCIWKIKRSHSTSFLISFHFLDHWKDLYPSWAWRWFGTRRRWRIRGKRKYKKYYTIIKNLTDFLFP